MPLQKLTVDPDKEVILPKELYVVLRRMNCWNQHIEEALEWLTPRPQQRKTFLEIFSHLDNVGISTFARLTNYYQNIAKGRNPLFNVKRALKLQMLKRKREALLEKTSSEDIHITLTNGISCTIHRPHISRYGAPFEATISYGTTTIKLNLTISQTLKLVESAEKLKTLKRIKPWHIQYKTKDHYQTIDRSLTKSVMNAIAEKLPIEIGVLIGTKKLEAK